MTQLYPCRVTNQDELTLTLSFSESIPAKPPVKIPGMTKERS